jgi:hypothetical protein
VRLILLIGLLVGLSGRVNEVHIDEPAAWNKRGYVELVPPLLLPTSNDENDDIRVWIKLPEGGRISVDKGRLVYPAGTVVERVEQVAGRVVDVRGTRFAADGERFHVLRAVGARLEGFEWSRGDADAQMRATELLQGLLRRSSVDERGIARLARLNVCASCHNHDRAEAKRQTDARPHRGTDGAGLYVPRSVLEDRAPLDQHRQRERNIGRFVTVSCGDGPAQLVEEGGVRFYRCANGAVPVGRFDIAAARAAGDSHAAAVCESRRWLRANLDDAGRAAFASAFAACGF